MTTVAIGLGSNLGDRSRLMLDALGRIETNVGKVLAVSPTYETEPWGVFEQPRFLNAACLVETSLCPFGVLSAMQAIEADLGRVRKERYGPRTIDLDILLYGGVVMSTTRLAIPHPGMLHRASVLLPLADIAAHMAHPISGRTLASHLGDLTVGQSAARYPPGLSAE